MGSRKDILKRSLGITEYPWSSDDELEAATNAVEETSLHRPPLEPRPASAGAAGPSRQAPPTSQQQQQRTQHHSQNQDPAWRRQDRDLFWSIINRPYRSLNQSLRTRSQSSELPLPRLAQLSSTRTSCEGARRGRGCSRPSPDVQRLVDFKRLTRPGSQRQRSLYTLPVRRVPSGYIVPAESTSDILNRCRARAALLASTSSRNRRASPPVRASQPPRSSWGESRDSAIRIANTLSSPPPLAPTGLENITEEFEVNNNPAPPPALPEGHRLSTLDEANEEIEEIDENEENEENEEPDASVEEVDDVEMSTSANVALEEEIETIDLDGDEVSTQVPVEEERKPANDAEFRRPIPIDAAVPSTSGAAASADAASELSTRNAKRRRGASIETSEPRTVPEFNQNLLRLLECPVCLEWMEPPMSQCRRGHLVCGACRVRLSSCPVCRTTFSSVRNRAMEGVAELVRYPCRHGCGHEVRMRRRAPHEASCVYRLYQCPAPLCADTMPLPREGLAAHFQSQHLPIMKMGRVHNFSMRINEDQHNNWLVFTMGEHFFLKTEVDIRTWGIVVYVSYIGPKCDSKNYTYQVTINGQHHKRKLNYTRATHSDLESFTLSLSRQDCFHLTLDQALNYIRFKNRHCDSDQFLDFTVEISKVEDPPLALEESDS